jgi:hypothetical protein
MFWAISLCDLNGLVIDNLLTCPHLDILSIETNLIQIGSSYESFR